MEWPVETTDEFKAWFEDLSESLRDKITAAVELLQEEGPQLRFPLSSGVAGSARGHMRELRVQHKGKPIRIFYAFDPRRVAMLLVGDDKTGDDRFYKKFVPLADQLYDVHIAELKRRKSIK